MDGLSIDQLILKGTHNSYACGLRRPACVNHPPDQQIDDFGVWSLELDFSLEQHGGGPVPVIGHSGPGHGACGAYFLSDYVDIILRARALQFRPIFVYLEVKRWKRPWRRPWQPPADGAYGFQEKWEAGLDVFRRTCQDRLVLLDRWILEQGRWPNPRELAGKVVLYEPNRQASDGSLLGLRGTHAGRYVTPDAVEAAISTGLPLQRDGAVCNGGARALRLNQYQADWTFDYGVPPNPLVVDPRAASETEIRDPQNWASRCRPEVSPGERVGEKGTYRFPFTSLERAVERARGITSATGGQPDPRRAGQGWTVLVKGSSTQSILEDDGLSLVLQPYVDE